MGLPYSRCCEGSSDEGEVKYEGSHLADVFPDTPNLGNMNSLEYVPAAYDAMCTVDYERSHVRYAKPELGGGSTSRANFKKSALFEEWLKRALSRSQLISVMDECGIFTSAVWFLDSACTTFTLKKNEIPDPVEIPLRCILSISSIRDIMISSPTPGLQDRYKERAVFIQYTNVLAQRQCICLLEESPAEKTVFLQAMSTLWMEERLLVDGVL